MHMVYAEAALGNNVSTHRSMSYNHSIKYTQGQDLRLLLSLDMDIIFRKNERVCHEGMAWYDLISLHYYNPAKALSI